MRSCAFLIPWPNPSKYLSILGQTHPFQQMKLLKTVMLLSVLASCNSGPNSQEQKFKIAVSNLRQVGFFEHHTDLDNEQLTALLMEQARKKYNALGYNEFDALFDPGQNADNFSMHVAKLDETRVWWRDVEADIHIGNDVYKTTAEKFAKISGGYLKANKIREEWVTDAGPVKLSFWDGDTLRVFDLRYYDDWFDTDFFKYLASAMKSNGSPFHFYMHEMTGQDIFVVRLTEQEKTKAEELVHWPLIKLGSVE